MMATYFHGGSEIQADNLHTLYLMNPTYTGFSSVDNQTPPSMLFLNPATAASQTNSLTPSSLQQEQHLVGIPLASPGDDAVAGRPSFHYNLWGPVAADGGHQAQIPTAIAVSSTGVGELGSPMGFRRPPPPPVSLPTTTTSLDDHHQRQQQGLSLSLNNNTFPNKNVNVAGRPIAVDGSQTSASATAGVTIGGGANRVILGSKYLKAAQQLLVEVVNVGNMGPKEKAKSALVEESVGRDSSGGKPDLTTAQTQELQIKKAKLINMLDEVHHRYRQYHSQIHRVTAWFEQAAGGGSARSYTFLALQTISKQFRCLKDSIASQIKATARSLGEDDHNVGAAGGSLEGSRSSRMRLVDHQLGMMQHNAWRPQRGLPEPAVTVLRAWLFDNFLHPYPKDSDKHMLAKQTGLTRSQVSNWFINARVRLWKPMVEDMYLEEMKSQQQKGSDDPTTSNNEHNNESTISSKSTASLPPSTPNSTLLISPSTGSAGPLQGFSLIGSSEMESMITQRSRKVQSSPSSILSMDMEMKPRGDNFAFLTPNHGGFGAYPIGDTWSRFNPDQQHRNGNAVSLTLGPPHSENLSINESHHHHNFIPGQAIHSWGGGWT